MKSLISMIISLFLVCIIAAGLLARVYTITKEKIDKQIEENLLKQLSDVLPLAKSFKEVIPDSLWIGYEDSLAMGKKVGIVFKAAPFGYAGPIPILVGFGTDSLVKKIYIASAAEGLKETPGLGLKITEKKFKDQFNNKSYNEIKLKKDGGAISAITAATISSNAVVNGIRNGIERYRKYLQNDTAQLIQTDTTIDESQLTRFLTLLPNATKFQTILKDSVWLGFDKTNNPIGIIFKVAPPGYNSLIPVYVGYGVDNTIRNIYICPPEEGLKETAGIGTKILEKEFIKQFENKRLSDLKFTAQGGTIQAISGATISSEAVLNGIRDGIKRYEQYLKTDSLKSK
ncbi:MAG: FMN-binding protein [candidate division WOR-3 bacterium]|nr:FMN-binding protein [candidate division WOR-3 bacterium]